MASLNDIETQIQNIIDIIEGRAISTITGVLPLTFRSNGTALSNYRIYGTAEGAGVETENEFDKNAQDTENGFISKAFINQDGSISSNNNYIVSEYIPIKASRPYFITFFTNNIPRNPAFVLYDENKEIIQGETYNSRKAILISENSTLQARYIRLSVATAGSFQADSATTLTEGSTQPETYIPHGYKLPLTITSGTESKDTDIYIGDSKLLSGDYVDYKSWKIVRNGIPQDPPLPFPELETYKGTNTLDSAETLGEVTIKGKIKEVI